MPEPRASLDVSACPLPELVRVDGGHERHSRLAEPFERVADPHVREHLIAQVSAYRRLRLLLDGQPCPADLVRFHAQHKLMLLAHSPAAYSALGRLVAGVRTDSIQRVLADYAPAFTTALGHSATRARHVNVLQHMAGYFRRLISDDARRDLMVAIDGYQRGLGPRVVPVRLLAHYTHLHDVRYLAEQAYLDPYLRELTVRTHV